MNRPHADYQVFLTHWKSLREPGALVVSSEVFLDNPDPLLSPNVLIVDVYDDDVVVRLVGTEIVERFGVDLTGKSMFTAHLPMKREDTLFNYGSVISQPCGLLSVNNTKTSGGRAVVSETLALPLGVLPDRPKRLISYSRLIEPLAEGEHSEQVAEYAHQDWIDIGAGVPSAAPLMPMLAG